MTQPKPTVSRMKPYVNGKHSGELFENSPRTMKLDSNESSVAPSAKVTAALTEFIHNAPLQWYPDIESRELITKLTTYTGLPADCIQTFNGSDNGLETVCRTFLQRGDEVILCTPTYDHFRVYAESCDAVLIPVTGDSPFETKADKLLEAVTPRTKIIYIVNPNNPTGTLYSELEVRKLLEEAPHALVIVDEAYFEFTCVSMAHLVWHYPNLMVSRSFSKAFGLAGLRCGYLLTQPLNLESINKIRIGKNINSLAQVAACAALDDLEHMRRYVSEVLTSKQWLLEKIKSLGLETRDTPANYILVRLAEPKQTVEYLEALNIYIRDRSFLPQLEGFVRITIGHQLMMKRFWEAFKGIPSIYLFDSQIKSEVQTG